MEGSQGRLRIGGWVFLLVVLAGYGMVMMVDASMALRALSFFGQVMHQVLPILLIVFLLLLAADLALKPEWIRRNIGREAGVRGWLIAIVGGVLATGPVYAWYALLQDLRRKGMQTSLAAVFLYSRSVKLPLLPLMIHYFGSTYTLVFCLYLLGFSVVSGLLMPEIETSA